MPKNLLTVGGFFISNAHFWAFSCCCWYRVCTVMSIILDFDRTISFGTRVQVLQHHTALSSGACQWEYAKLTGQRGIEHFLERILWQHLAQNT